MIRVLMVCTGNICRSPMAEAVFRDAVKRAGLDQQIEVDSAGISDEELGNTTHPGTVRVLTRHNIPHDPKRPARPVNRSDFERFDYLLAMDYSHEEYLQMMALPGEGQIQLFLSEAYKAGDVSREDVPDPWYDGQYDRTYDLVTRGCQAFLTNLRQRHNL